MKPVKIEGATNLFKPPVDWDEKAQGPCGDLWVRIGDGFGSTRLFESAWKPSGRELEKLIYENGVIIISVVGMQPAISLSVE